MVQLHVADDIAQGGGAQVFDGAQRPLDAVGEQLGVGDLEEHHSVDLHGDVIAGDHRLGLEVHHLLLEGYLFGHAVDKRHFHMHAGGPGGVVAAQPLHHEYIGLGNDADVRHGDQQRDGQQNQHNSNKYAHNFLLV